jgi:conjugal transfer mating pair stabilization protein TraN
MTMCRPVLLPVHLLKLLLIIWGVGTIITASPAQAQQMCAADLNGNGDAADPGEFASCDRLPNGMMQCPLQQTACILEPAGDYRCPLGSRFACEPHGVGATCSPHQCQNLSNTPIVETPPFADPGTEADGLVDPDGTCLGTIEIFGGRAMRCRPAGIATTFANCCKDKGKIVTDGMGSSINAIGTKIAVAKGVFTGMSAAFTAFRAGASVG